MSLVQTRGAASAQGFGEFAQSTSVAANYIEDMFSCFLYTGTGATQTITNNIDLSTKGGLVWLKARGTAGYDHLLFDTARGTGNFLSSNLVSSASTSASTLTAFNTTGFSLGNDAGGWGSNISAVTTVSWTFRKQPKFFDIQTWTGSGANRTISHALGSVPACIMVKRTDTTSDWAVYHRSLANTQYLVLNSTAAAATGATWWNSTTPTSSVFSLGTDASVNASAGTYVAYIFAHDAGGFGLTGTDNVISCGSVSATGGTPAVVNLGYEPQWLLIKGADITNGWSIIDNMRGFTANSGVSWLQPNTTAAEVASPSTPSLYLTSTGFKVESNESPLNGTGTYIYIAIRRGPMKVPTVGTSVFFPKVIGGQGVTQNITGFGFPVDLAVPKNMYNTETWAWTDRLRGPKQELTSAATTAETTYANDITSFALMNGYIVGSGAGGNVNTDGTVYVHYGFRRAPSFFDQVCSTDFIDGTLITHNLGVIPELIIVKTRASASNWMGAVNDAGNIRNISVNTTSGGFLPSYVYSSYFNATTINPAGILNGGGGQTKGSGVNAVIYLFATCAGVSKVGSYTGTGTTKQIDCGFTAGARFVLIKRTDSTGDWYVWDTTRGIIAGNDPYLLLNSTAAEVTSTDYIDTYSAGFEISSTAPAAINASAGTFIFLAIA